MTASKARSMTRATSVPASAPGGNGARTLCAACQKASCKVRERPSGFLSPLLDASVLACCWYHRVRVLISCGPPVGASAESAGRRSRSAPRLRDASPDSLELCWERSRRRMSAGGCGGRFGRTRSSGRLGAGVPRGWIWGRAGDGAGRGWDAPHSGWQPRSWCTYVTKPPRGPCLTPPPARPHPAGRRAGLLAGANSQSQKLVRKATTGDSAAKKSTV